MENIMQKPTFSFLKYTISPLILIFLCPPTVFLFWYTNVHLNGSLLQLYELIRSIGIENSLYTIWKPYIFGSVQAWKVLFIFIAFEVLLMRYLPGKMFQGPVTPEGNRPIYRDNGLLGYAITLAIFGLCAFQFQLFSPTIIYDLFPELLGALNGFSILFCFFLLIKGYIKPSSSDSGSSGNLIFDYYWGTELYPRVWGFDIKRFTNCRFGMMSWPLILISFATKQYELYGSVSNSMIIAVFLQLVYITKFFIWETGYLSSLDIMHDRAGFYICWGCLVWVPGIYTSPTLYLVDHPNQLSLFWAAVITILGVSSILINYFADRQRQKVRQFQGACTIWGKKPSVTVARYKTETGELKENLLLTSGWWGVARHFHYIPEILGAFFWSVPALFTHFLPYFYVIYLTILLTQRAFRDDQRCFLKYGEDWLKYCEKVPYKMIPYII